MTPEERERVLGVRMLARSMARKWRTTLPLDADDLEQAALLELCRSLPKWDGCQPFEWFAWHRFRAGIAEEVIRASWRKRNVEVLGRVLARDVDVALIAAPAIEDADEVDGCVICGTPMGDQLTRGRVRLYCSPACRHALNKLRQAASNAV